MDAARDPSAPGAKTRPTMQKPLGATFAPVQWSVPGARVKSLRGVPVMVKPLTVIVAVPALTRATVWTVDVVPSAWLKKFDTGGATPAITVAPAAAAEPFRVRVWGLPVALSVKVTVAVRAPVVLPVGENVTDTVQVVVTTVQVLDILKSAALVPPSVTDEKVTVPPEA